MLRFTVSLSHVAYLETENSFLVQSQKVATEFQHSIKSVLSEQLIMCYDFMCSHVCGTFHTFLCKGEIFICIPYIIYPVYLIHFKPFISKFRDLMPITFSQEFWKICYWHRTDCPSCTDWKHSFPQAPCLMQKPILFLWSLMESYCSEVFVHPGSIAFYLTRCL